jgi:hypothetical protein
LTRRASGKQGTFNDRPLQRLAQDPRCQRRVMEFDRRKLPQHYPGQGSDGRVEVRMPGSQRAAAFIAPAISPGTAKYRDCRKGGFGLLRIAGNAFDSTSHQPLYVRQYISRICASTVIGGYFGVSPAARQVGMHSTLYA